MKSLCFLTVILFCPLPVFAQFALQPVDAGEARFDKQLTQRWQVGVTVQAVGGPCVGLYGTVPVPNDWPEQTVKIVAEDVSPHVRAVKYRVLDGGVKQMMFTIPQLAPGDTATALFTFEVTKSSVLPPADTNQFSIPKRIPKDVRLFLGTSPYVETRHARIRAQLRDIVADIDGDWQQVEAIYDWVRDHVEYTNGKLKGAAAALQDRTGDKEDLTSLFIALCRAHKVPARTVWVPDHCYAEFYLENKAGEGIWFPCQVAGSRDFGAMSDHRIILQKGENIKVPEKSEPQRFVAEMLKGQAIRGGGRPQVTFVRKMLAGP